MTNSQRNQLYMMLHGQEKNLAYIEYEIHRVSKQLWELRKEYEGTEKGIKLIWEKIHEIEAEEKGEIE